MVENLSVVVMPAYPELLPPVHSLEKDKLFSVESKSRKEKRTCEKAISEGPHVKQLGHQLLLSNSFCMQRDVHDRHMVGELLQVLATYRHAILPSM